MTAATSARSGLIGDTLASGRALPSGDRFEFLSDRVEFFAGRLAAGRHGAVLQTVGERD